MSALRRAHILHISIWIGEQNSTPQKAVCKIWLEQQMSDKADNGPAEFFKNLQQGSPRFQKMCGFFASFEKKLHWKCAFINILSGALNPQKMKI